MTPTVYINFCNGIDDVRVRTIMGVCTEVMGHSEVSELYFLFSSPGGMVHAGITLYSFLKGMPLKIIMHNTGAVDSVATAIYMAGAERYACSHASFLFHGVASNIQAGMPLSAARLREMLSQLEQDENKIAQVVTSNSQLSDAEIRHLFKEGESKTATYALEKGVVHNIREVSVPRNATMITIQ